jgi:hypothetical protein
MARMREKKKNMHYKNAPIEVLFLDPLRSAKRLQEQDSLEKTSARLHPFELPFARTKAT